MHAATHRALRELNAFARQLARHWDRLGLRLGGDEATVLSAGVTETRLLLSELSALCALRDLYGVPAAATAGRFVTARPLAGDALLERNQAMRFAVLDVQHCVTLLLYLRALAAHDGDEELRRFCGRWERRLRTHERTVRAAAVACGEHPDSAIAPADTSAAGRIGQRVSSTVGAVGEWVDRQAAGRRRA